MIKITNKIKMTLNRVNKEDHAKVLKSAWDACCDGEYLSGFDFKFDPWDGEHEAFREQIEFEAVEESIKLYQEEN